MAKDAPKAMDPATLISQQARANRVGTVSPFGTVTYYEDQGGKRNDTRAEIELSPQQAAILEQQQLAQRIAGKNAVAGLGAFAGAPDASRQRVEEAVFSRGLSLLNPELKRRELAMQQRLANQGLPQTSGAYNREYGRFETGVNKALEDLALSAVLQGGNEQTRQLNQILAQYGLAAPQTPQVFAPGQVDVLGPYAMDLQAQTTGFNAQQQLLGGLLGLGGQLGGAAIMGSASPAEQQRAVAYGYGYG